MLYAVFLSSMEGNLSLEEATFLWAGILISILDGFQTISIKKIGKKDNLDWIINKIGLTRGLVATRAVFVFVLVLATIFSSVIYPLVVFMLSVSLVNSIAIAKIINERRHDRAEADRDAER